MKKLLFTLAAATMLSAPALADDHNEMKAGAKTNAEAKASINTDAMMKSDVLTVIDVEGLVENTDVEYLASEGIGRDVYSQNMQKIGEVKDYGITADGKVEYVLVGFDKGLFDAETDKAVPHDMLMWNEGEQKLVYEGNVEAAMNAEAGNAVSKTLNKTEKMAKDAAQATENAAEDAVDATTNAAQEVEAEVDASVDADADVE